ncbi:hypothetical protein BC827DRAFT_140823 [Russula dissimulans]|nr:hypothetical protein BC827DRAFT_140823 [Russula dissimulans]
MPRGTRRRWLTLWRRWWLRQLWCQSKNVVRPRFLLSDPWSFIWPLISTLSSYTCGGVGHLSRDCGQGSKCYNCSGVVSVFFSPFRPFLSRVAVPFHVRLNRPS